MLYTVIIGRMAPNYVAPTTNTFTQQIYLGISGRHNIKIKAFEFNATPSPADGARGVLVRINELYMRSNTTTLGGFNFAFLHIEHVHDYELDLGIQDLNNYLTFTITAENVVAGGPGSFTNLDMVLYLEIEEETKYLLK
jgi:hypothetical protein